MRNDYFLCNRNQELQCMLNTDTCKHFVKKEKKKDSDFYVCRLEKQNKIKTNRQYSLLIVTCIS